MKQYTIFLRSTQVVFMLLLSMALFSGCTNEEVLKYYVSVDGDDHADGSIDKPYLTLNKAVDELRTLRKSGNTNPFVIYLREGRHQLNQTLILGVEDGRSSSSNPIELEEYGAGESTETAYLTIAAYPNEHPVISSGIPIKSWKKLELIPSELPEKSAGKVWVADIPDGLDNFYTLYNQKGRLNRARGAGFAPTKPGTKRTLHFPTGTIKNWDNISDVEIQVRPKRVWVINMLPLERVDEATGVATTKVSATYDMSPIPITPHSPDGVSVWVENTLEELDEPGEWVVNTKTRKIYLWPSEPAQDGSPQGIMVPSLFELIRIEGEINYEGAIDKPVRGITFSGLTFSHADRRAWTNEEERLGWGMQHDWDMFDRPTSLLRFRGAEDCQVIECDFIHTGGTGLRFDLHAQRNRVENCEFSHLGEAGIVLAGYGPGTKDVNHHNDIVNNHIHDFSEITWHSPGIWAWQSGHNHIHHNYIHHSGYAAVLITNRVEPDRALDGEGGRTVRHSEIPSDIKDSVLETYDNWKTREKYNHSRHNLLEYNEITHSVQRLSDGNTIYVSGAGTGNTVRYNHIHDNLAPTLPSAIRCDDDQHETIIYGNVLYNNTGTLSQIASKGVNHIINNFIVAPAQSPNRGYISFQWVPVTGSKVSKNIIIAHPDGKNIYGERERMAKADPGFESVYVKPNIEETDMDSNLYFHESDAHWADKHLSRMRAVGKEQATLFGDPLFIDPANGNFDFQPNSPAIKLGIEPLDVSKMGLLTNQQ